VGVSALKIGCLAPQDSLLSSGTRRCPQPDQARKQASPRGRASGPSARAPGPLPAGQGPIATRPHAQTRGTLGATLRVGAMLGVLAGCDSAGHRGQAALRVPPAAALDRVSPSADVRVRRDVCQLWVPLRTHVSVHVWTNSNAGSETRARLVGLARRGDEADPTLCVERARRVVSWIVSGHGTCLSGTAKPSSDGTLGWQQSAEHLCSLCSVETTRRAGAVPCNPEPLPPRFSSWKPIQSGGVPMLSRPIVSSSLRGLPATPSSSPPARGPASGLRSRD
jgi:hypothetical protein